MNEHITAKKINIFDLFEQLKSLKEKQLLSEAIRLNLKKIQEICDARFAGLFMHGNDALNRKILLDSEIADCLTPEVVRYLFTQPASDITLLKRNALAKKAIVSADTDIKSVILYGFKSGIEAIEKLRNNDGIDDDTRKRDYEKNTLKIVSNLLAAAGENASEVADSHQSDMLLTLQYETLLKEIIILKNNRQADLLVGVASCTADGMREQARRGFETLCDNLKVNHRLSPSQMILDVPSLSDFCHRILNDENRALLKDSYISHMLFDSGHFLALLEQDFCIQIAGKNYHYRDIFSELTKQIESSSQSYAVEIKKNLELRFNFICDKLDSVRKLPQPAIPEKSTVPTKKTSEFSKPKAASENPKNNEKKEPLQNIKTTLEEIVSLQQKREAYYKQDKFQYFKDSLIKSNPTLESRLDKLDKLYEKQIESFNVKIEEKKMELSEYKAVLEKIERVERYEAPLTTAPVSAFVYNKKPEDQLRAENEAKIEELKLLLYLKNNADLYIADIKRLAKYAEKSSGNQNMFLETHKKYDSTKDTLFLDALEHLKKGNSEPMRERLKADFNLKQAVKILSERSAPYSPLFQNYK